VTPAERRGLGRPVEPRERLRNRQEQVARDEREQPGRVDPDQVRTVDAGPQDLADHLLAARERHERRLDGDPALGHGRVEQLGLSGAERVEEPDRRRRRRRRLATARAREQRQAGHP
jgi:hypothetical protein